MGGLSSVTIVTMAYQVRLDLKYEKMFLANKVNFRYFIFLAMQNKMSWEGVGFVLDDLASTLPKSKEVIQALLKELQKLKSANVDETAGDDETNEQLGIENQIVETETMIDSHFDSENRSESISDSSDQLDINYLNVTKDTDQEIQSAQWLDLKYLKQKVAYFISDKNLAAGYVNKVEYIL